MNYVVQTHSGKEFRISELQATYAAAQKNKGQVLQFKNYPGEFVIASDVKSITKLSETPDRTPLELTAGEVFTKSATPGFWQHILRLNQAGKDQKTLLPWLYAPFIEECRTLSGITDPLELFAFITAEWDNLPLALNIPSLIKRTSHT